MIDEILAFINGNPIKTLDVQISEQTTAIEGSIDTMQSELQSKIDEMQDYLSSYRIDASDTVYFQTNNAEFKPTHQNVGGEPIDAIPITLVIKAGGIVRLKYIASYLNFYIFINGVSTLLSFDSSSNVSYSKDITVNKGDVITFGAQGRGTTSSYWKLTANSVIFCGYLTPLMETNLIELI